MGTTTPAIPWANQVWAGLEGIWAHLESAADMYREEPGADLDPLWPDMIDEAIAGFKSDDRHRAVLLDIFDESPMGLSSAVERWVEEAPGGLGTPLIFVQVLIEMENAAYRHGVLPLGH